MSHNYNLNINLSIQENQNHPVISLKKNFAKHCNKKNPPFFHQFFFLQKILTSS